MNYFSKSFEGKVGVVSGAGQGQGKAVVKLLLEHGAKVTIRGGSRTSATTGGCMITPGENAPQMLNIIGKNFAQLGSVM